ncbi:MAG: asparagine synthase (glutamine-hydrolyzing) [Flavobacteriales bacterium]|nr:asparagine synthase (glutamine-hydrolyzing) [Flavobacteriales bacterium]
MCGITGLYSFDHKANHFEKLLEEATTVLSKRGPDAHGTYADDTVLLGHRRLSIIDTSPSANQPFTSEDGRYRIVYNGEFYNFKEHRNQLEKKGISSTTSSDTEVILKLYIQEGADALKKINGFFGLAIYDNHEKSLFIARDRFGIKPLLYYQDSDKFIFASELKSILKYQIEREINPEALHLYFRFNYIPGSESILSNVFKLKPGHYIKIKDGDLQVEPYYELKSNQFEISDYDSAKNQLKALLTKSVTSRMVSDVPLGTFLSGGIDSSIISTIASKQTNNLKTFSIGYKDEPFFDETRYAHLVAEKIKTDHQTFYLTNDDFSESLSDILDYLDEPFADSSAIAVYILSKKTKEQVSVILSGDGADEIFSGYNKHMAEFKVLNPGLKEKLARSFGWVAKFIPQSRNSSFSNFARQINKFYEGGKLSVKDRYWLWASIMRENEVNQLLKPSPNQNQLLHIQNELLASLKSSDFNDFLKTDTNMVLVGDMLRKVDAMSMANSLEVRTPFLDQEVVEFAFSLPTSFKIDHSIKKKILQEAFRQDLPNELFMRPKHGFEVPLLKWFRKELASLLDELTNKEFILSQNIFNWDYIKYLKAKLHSSNPGDTAAKIWAIIVFQRWWLNYMR